jgi:hypothetical protein
MCVEKERKEKKERKKPKVPKRSSNLFSLPPFPPSPTRPHLFFFPAAPFSAPAQPSHAAHLLPQPASLPLSHAAAYRWGPPVGVTPNLRPPLPPHGRAGLPHRRPASPAPRARPPPPLRHQGAASPLPFPSRNRLHRAAAAAINGAPAELRHRLSAPFPFPLRPIKGQHHPCVSRTSPLSSSLTAAQSPPEPERHRRSRRPISSSAVIPTPPSPW